MQGLASLLAEPFYSRVTDLWDELEKTHGLVGVRITPFPHFTWQIAQEYDLQRMQPVLAAAARRTPPFQVRTSGLGLFTGPRPVLYIPVVKTAMLLRVHAELWEILRPALREASPYYSPGNWIPHITLAFEDISEENIGAVLKTLTFRSFDWEMTVDNLVFASQPEGGAAVLEQTLKLLG